MTFRLLSEEVTSEPNSTHPAEQTTLLLLPVSVIVTQRSSAGGGGGGQQPTAFNSKYIIHQSFIDDLRAQRRDEVHI